MSPIPTLCILAQMRNLAAALLTAHGVPMVLMGDEYGHSKGGNNNTYCHDSRLNWFDWDAAQAPNNGFARFFQHLVNFRYRLMWNRGCLSTCSMCY